MSVRECTNGVPRSQVKRVILSMIFRPEAGLVQYAISDGSE